MEEEEVEEEVMEWAIFFEDVGGVVSSLSLMVSNLPDVFLRHCSVSMMMLYSHFYDLNLADVMKMVLWVAPCCQMFGQNSFSVIGV